MSILLVEDEAGLAKIVTDSLEFKGYSVRHCLNGKEGLASFMAEKPDIIILDVMMPHMDGFNLAIKIRAQDTKTPIIFLTARTQTTDVLKGFEIGANDYIKKPFSIEELIVRINFQLKQTEKSIDKKYTIGNYNFDGKNQLLSINDQVRTLSYRESELLRKLCEHQHEILTRKDLIDDLWEHENFFTGRSLDVFISRIRTYLKEDPQVRIINIRKAGYQLVIKKDEFAVSPQ
ncbi:response regulator transcription factor [Pedobacter sp. MC2016-24]|uniref:response regulator transcription factor n=1 Tax=Pedobacter sp. MC2016-24 TaxID=2780090 RepID=UPI001881B966|nr:response regulator transcription factor [Pedobacter sp. MC2016-24]MBE9602091.1 response regulator transcription factor [Pedobacter sp. MC2016-24]